MSYRFDGYLEALGENWLDDDPLLRRWVERSSPGTAELEWLDGFGRAAAGRYREIADRVERRENLPRLEEADPYDGRNRQVWIPAETRQVLAEVHGSGIWRAATDERLRYAAVYLLNANGEFGITCSTACTDGLARAARPRHGRTQPGRCGSPRAGHAGVVGPRRPVRDRDPGWQRRRDERPARRPRS